MTKMPGKKIRRRIQFSMSIGQAIGFLAVAGVVVAWSMTTTGYIVFKDDVLVQLAVRHRSMQDDYEKRISELRRNMEQIRTASLAEKAMLGTKLDALIEFQAELQQRQDAVSALVGAAPVTPARTERPAVSMPKPRPLDAATPGDELSLRSTHDPIITASISSSPWRSNRRSLPSQFERAETGYQQLKAAQDNLLSTLETRSTVERTSLQVVYNHIGVQPVETSGQGGPFIAASDVEEADNRITRIRSILADVHTLRDGLTTLPIGLPAKVRSMSSDFGNRMDPFLGRPAFHAGIDFGATTGTPVYATASGRVAEAGRNGGYGLMVELAHEHGLSTRYAHLSAVAVQEGARVDVGQLVGYVGSTGRSTGPHLHYETRRADKALDPSTFIEAGKMAQSIER